MGGIMGLAAGTAHSGNPVFAWLNRAQGPVAVRGPRTQFRPDALPRRRSRGCSPISRLLQIVEG